MDRCEEILELLSARLDGPLTAGEERFLERHLDGCSACRALAEDLEALHAVMPELEEAPPPGIKEAVMARIKAEVGEPIPLPVKRTPVRRWQAWGAAAAVVLLVAAGGFGLPGGMGGSGGNAGTMMSLASPEAAPSSIPPSIPSSIPSPVPAPSSPSALLPDTYAGRGEEITGEAVPEEGAAVPGGDSALRHTTAGVKKAGDTALETPQPTQELTGDMRPFQALTAVLTPEQAAQRLCDEVLGEEPQEETWNEDGFSGCLLPGGWSVSYLGLSEDGTTHEFQVYVGAEEGRRYAVPLDGSEIYLLDGEESK